MTVSETYWVVVLVPDLSDWRHEFALYHQMFMIIDLGQLLNLVNLSNTDVGGRESKIRAEKPGPPRSRSPKMKSNQGYVQPEAGVSFHRVMTAFRLVIVALNLQTIALNF